MERLAADALAQSRMALPALRQITQDLLFGDAKAQAEAILGSIERRDIFRSCVSWDLSDLIRHLDTEIDDPSAAREVGASELQVAIAMRDKRKLQTFAADGLDGACAQQSCRSMFLCEYLHVAHSGHSAD